MDEIISLISSVGFPIVMCLWFMFRTEKVMNRNTEATEKLSLILESLERK